VSLVVLPPVMDSGSRPVAAQVVQQLDINTSTELEPLRRVLKQVEVVDVAFDPGAIASRLISGYLTGS
jgi:hypothetical protein